MTTTLYRPVGPQELALIEASGWRAFPPRLPEQPIFYPVLNEAYAIQIARDWNVPASGSGYVTRFAVRTDFLARYEIQTVGAAMHQELWIPAEDLTALNETIIGLIEVTAEFRANDKNSITSIGPPQRGDTKSTMNVETLIADIAAGMKPKWYFFWGHTPAKDGSITKSCFSQWWAEHPFVIDGISYPTAEHWMMAEKARLFGDGETCGLILKASHPNAAKKLGRQVRNFDEARWRQARCEIVIRGNEAKFERHKFPGNF